MCYTTAHYSPPPSDPLLHSISTYSHHHLHAPPQNHYHNLHASPQNHHHIHAPPKNHNNNQYDYYPPPETSQIHQKSNPFQKYNHQETFQETPPQPPINPSVSSLVHRIAALESTLPRHSSKNSPGSSSVRVAAARTIQTHFRAYLVRRSVTLRHLKELAFVKSSLNHLKSLVSDKPHFDSYFISRESLNLLIKLNSIQGSDPMIRDGKKSISRELIRFMELIDEMSKESEVISVKNVRFSTNGKKSVILQKQDKFRVSGDNERKFSEKLKTQIKKLNGLSLDVENPRTEALLKSQRVVKSQPKVKKNVSFDENGNVYRLIKSKHSHVSSDGSDSSNNGDGEEVEEIGVSSKETEVVVEEEEDSSEMSESEMDPRKNLGTRIHNTAQKNQPSQKNNDNKEDDDDEEEKDDSFVFSAPLPAKMEYRVDSANKKQTAKH